MFYGKLLSISSFLWYHLGNAKNSKVRKLILRVLKIISYVLPNETENQLEHLSELNELSHTRLPKNDHFKFLILNLVSIVFCQKIKIFIMSMSLKIFCYFPEQILPYTTVIESNNN